jgi:hypothetical protein
VDDVMLADERTYVADLADDSHPWRHDSVKLAQVIMDIYNQRTGPLA